MIKQGSAILNLCCSLKGESICDICGVETLKLLYKMCEKALYAQIVVHWLTATHNNKTN